MDRLSHPWPFRLVIPTRNSARWLRPFLYAYRALGVRPLYVLDSRSSDATADILATEAADVVEVTPAADRVEAVMCLIPQLCPDARWILRLDDDEFPAEAAIAWIAGNLDGVDADSVLLSRRSCLLGGDGVPVWSEAEMFFWHQERPDLVDPQPRLFRPDRVVYHPTIHTPGFDCGTHAFAPASAHFSHFDWIIRTPAERLAKLRGYEAQSSGSGQDFMRYYLPEIIDPFRLRATLITDAGIASLAREVALPRLGWPPPRQPPG